MSYSVEISRANRTCMVFLIDQSGSMKDAIGGSSTIKAKASGAADAINRLLSNLLIKCSKPAIWDYFDVAVIGYGKSVGPAFGGALAGRQFVSIVEISNNLLRAEERKRKVEDGAGGIVEETEKFKVWLEPMHEGGTPMCQALNLVHDMLTGWVASHPASYPPIVINITDGESTDGNPEQAAEAVKNLGTQDGNVLLFNCDISSSSGSKALFPSTPDQLPDVPYERTLFKMSSELPEKILAVAQEKIEGVQSGARGFAFQAELVDLIQFLDIGSQGIVGNLR